MIVRYQREDIPQIIDLENRVLHTTLGEEMLVQGLTNDMSYYYVYKENNRIIGYISMSFDGYQGEILNFCVEPEYQRKGIGTKLISYVIDVLFAKGAESFVLEVRQSNQKAISFYQRIGFHQISVRKNYYSNGENALVFLKQMVLFDDIEDAYIQAFCKMETHEEYIKFYSEMNPLKYFHNFYRVQNETIMKALYHRPGFVQFELKKPYVGDLPFHSKENEIFYHTNIHNIEIRHHVEATCYCCKEENKEKLEGILYADAMAFGEEYALLTTQEQMYVTFEKKKTYWYIIEDEGMFVGFLCAFLYQDAAKLEDFVISDSYQKKGYGSTLLQYVLEDLKTKGIHDIFLCADMDDTPKYMYEGMGFHPIGKKYIVREVFK